MPSVTYQYVYYAPGPHQRQPTRSGGGGFVTISSNSGGSLSPGDSFAAPPPPPTQSVDGRTLPFSFMTVAGGSQTAGGPPVGLTSVEAGNPPPPVFVGSVPINVVAVYVGTGGPPGTGSGATIDAFDTTTGQLIDDRFGVVSQDPFSALTERANKEGFVDTTNSAETISAFAITAGAVSDPVAFAGWMNLGPPAVLSDQSFSVLDPNTTADLAVDKGQSVLALAFYQATLQGQS